MTRPISEDNEGKRASQTEFGVRQLFRRPAAKIVAVYHIKVVGDQQVVVTVTDKFIWAIEEDIAGMALAQVEIDVTTATAADLTVQLRNVDNGNVNMLSTEAQIDAGDKHSGTSGTPSVVNIANATVSHMDRIAIDITDGGSAAQGLGLVAKFSAPV
jgi:hypothetical protein